MLVLAALALGAGCRDTASRDRLRRDSPAPGPPPGASATAGPSGTADDAGTGPGPSLGPARPSGCSIEASQRTVRPQVGAIRACYRRALRSNPALRGRILVEITVDRAGHQFLGVKEDTLRDSAVTRCVFQVLRPLPFPRPAAGSQACTTLYPFSFSAGPAKLH